MKIITLLFLVLLPTALTAQITVTDSDMPNVNDTFRISVGDSLLITNVDTTGTNFTWDYSFLQPDTQNVDTFLGFFDWPLIYKAVFGPLGNNSTYAVTRESADSVGGLIIEDIYDFFKNSGTQYEYTGFGAKINGITTPIKNDTNDIIYRFPVSYGNVDSSNSSYKIDLTGTLGIYYGRRQKRINYVDGWGTLITPFGTFQTLRVKSVIYRTDTISLDTLGGGFTTSLPVLIEYKWLGNGNGIPLLQINAQMIFGIPVVNRVVYLDSLGGEILQTVEQKIAQQEDFIIYPNPVDGEIRIKFALLLNQLGTVTIYDLQGQMLLKTPVNEDLHNILIDVNEFRPGIYLFKMVTKNSVQTRKLVIVR